VVLVKLPVHTVASMVERLREERREVDADLERPVYESLRIGVGRASHAPRALAARMNSRGCNQSEVPAQAQATFARTEVPSENARQAIVISLPFRGVRNICAGSHGKGCVGNDRSRAGQSDPGHLQLRQVPARQVDYR
jgi:hypothetical protein